MLLKKLRPPLEEFLASPLPINKQAGVVALEQLVVSAELMTNLQFCSKLTLSFVALDKMRFMAMWLRPAKWSLFRIVKVGQSQPKVQNHFLEKCQNLVAKCQ